MNERIKQLRTALGLSRETFGGSLGSSGSVIKNLEYEKTTPKPAFVKLICQTYNVNPLWLETGEGEIFLETTSYAINERITFLRKEVLQLSQTVFGEKLGVSRDVINNIEHNRTVPSTLLINHICTVFNINPVWINSGESEMLKRPSHSVFDENISDNFKLMLIQSILTLDDDELQLLKKVLKKFTSIMNEEQE